MTRTVAPWLLLLLLAPAAPAAPAGDAPAKEDPLPEGALYRLGVSRLRHGGTAVICCAFSPDGKVLASVGNDNLVKLWDPATGKLIREMKGHNGGVQGCAFTSDGKHLLTCSMDTTLKLWEVATGKEEMTLTGHTAAVLPVAVSPDGKLGASEGQDATVRVWDLAAGKELRTLPGHDSQGTTNLAFSPDSKHLVTVGEDFALRLWDLNTGREVRQFKGHQADSNSVEFSKDGKQLISASNDKTVKLWNVATGQLVRTFEGHTDFVSTARLCPDGKTMISGGMDRTLRLWDLNTGKEVRRFDGHHRTVSEVTVTPDSKVAATAGHDGTLRLWDLTTGEELPQSAGLDAAAVSPGGKVLATGGGAWVRLWDPLTGKPLPQKFDQEAAIVRLAFADDKTLAVLGDDEKVRLWDLGAGKLIRELKPSAPMIQPPPGGVRRAFLTLHSLGVSADGKLVVAADRDNAMAWDGGTGKDLERPFQTEESRRDGFLRSLALSRDGRVAATANDNGGPNAAVRVWDAARGQELRSLPVPPGGAGRVTLSDDGRTLAAAVAQPTLRLWETATGLDRARLPQPNSLATAVALSRDGRLLAAADFEKGLHVYDVLRGEELGTLPGHGELVSDLAFLPDNKGLVSVGSDGTVLTWDLSAPLKKLAPLPAKLEAKALDAAWADLGADDGIKAYAAVWALSAAAEQSLPLFRDRLNKDEAKDDVKKIPQWLKDLDSDEFAVREKATKELERMGRLAERQLQDALAKPASLEVKLRVERLLDKLKEGARTPDERRTLRAVECLEKMRNSEAKKVLETLASGPEEAVSTREAKAALEHLRQP